MEDVAFIFNPQGIINGVNKASNAMGNFGKKTAEVGSGIGKTLARGIKSVGTFALKLGAAGLAVTGLTASLGGIPEIGEAFKIAGGIFVRNFLEPLRRELLPLLNRMLQWVTDNRAAFVRMGSVLVSVFRIISGIVSGIISLFEKMFNSIKSVLTEVFGETTQSISDTFKVLITQIAFFSQIILALLEPVFETIGKLVGVVLSGLIGLFQGIISEGAPVINILRDIISQIKGLVDFLFTGTGVAGGFRDVMFSIGRIIGRVLVAAFEGLKTAISFVINLIKGIVEGLMSVEGISSAWDAFVGAVMRLVDALGSVFKSGKSLNPVFRILGRIIGVVLGTAIKIILKSLGLLIDGLTWMIKNIPKLIDFVIRLGKDAFGTLINIWDTLVSTAQSVIGAFAFFIDRVKQIAVDVFDILVKPFREVVSALKELGNKILKFFTNIWEKIKQLAASAFNFVQDKISSVVKGVQSFFGLADETDKKTAKITARTVSEGARFQGTTNNIQNAKSRVINNNQRTNITINSETGDPQEIATQVTEQMDIRQQTIDERVLSGGLG